MASTAKHTSGATRAAKVIRQHGMGHSTAPWSIEDMAVVIDQQTAAPALLEALQELYDAAPEPRSSTQDADRLIKAAAAIKAATGS